MFLATTEKAGETADGLCSPKVCDSVSEEWIPEKAEESVGRVYGLYEWRASDSDSDEWISDQFRDPDLDSSDSKEEAIYLREIKIYLMWKREWVLAKGIKSSDDLMKKAPDLWEEFEHKKWFLNRYLLVDELIDDDYRLLCVRKEKRADDFIKYYKIASSIESDLAYDEFFVMLHDDIKWDDSDKECLKKAKKLRDASMPFIDEKLLPICADECKKWRWKRQYHEESTNLLMELFNETRQKKSNFPSEKFKKKKKKKNNKKKNDVALNDVFYMALLRIRVEKKKCFPLWMKHILSDLDINLPLDPVRMHFKGFSFYLECNSMSEPEPMKNIQFYASKYSEMFLGDLKPSNYLYYVTEKIRLAAELGIFKKEDFPDMSEWERMLDSCLSSLKFTM